MSEQPGKYARFELERRFLVSELPEDVERESWHITDLYITETQLRLRRMEPAHGGKAILKLGQKHVPSPPDFGRMTITNLYLSPREYSLLAGLPGVELRKRRFTATHRERGFGIDVFEGNLAGLLLAETDFSTHEEFEQALDLPDWIRAEVTTDKRFTGGALVSLSPDEATAFIEEVTGRGGFDVDG